MAVPNGHISPLQLGGSGVEDGSLAVPMWVSTLVFEFVVLGEPVVAACSGGICGQYQLPTQVGPLLQSLVVAGPPEMCFH